MVDDPSVIVPTGYVPNVIPEHPVDEPTTGLCVICPEPVAEIVTPLTVIEFPTEGNVYVVVYPVKHSLVGQLIQLEYDPVTVNVCVCPDGAPLDTNSQHPEISLNE